MKTDAVSSLDLQSGITGFDGLVNSLPAIFYPSPLVGRQLAGMQIVSYPLFL